MGVVGGVGDEPEEALAVEERRGDGDVWQVGVAAEVRIVGDEHVAGADGLERVMPQDLVDDAGDGAEVLGLCWPWAMTSPVLSMIAVEQSRRSLMLVEYDALTRISSISSAMASRCLPMTSTVIGSRSTVVLMPKSSASTGDCLGTVVLTRPNAVQFGIRITSRRVSAELPHRERERAGPRCQRSGSLTLAVRMEPVALMRIRHYTRISARRRSPDWPVVTERNLGALVRLRGRLASRRGWHRAGDAAPRSLRPRARLAAVLRAGGRARRRPCSHRT